MRPLIAASVTALLATSPALAQPGTFEQDVLRAQQEAARRDAVNLTNQLSVLESRLRTEQALSDLRAQREGVPVPELRYEPAARGSASPAATPKYPSAPDAILADSNRKVREASRPRR